jgi:hypothetical protein
MRRPTGREDTPARPVVTTATLTFEALRRGSGWPVWWRRRPFAVGLTITSSNPDVSQLDGGSGPATFSPATPPLSPLKRPPWAATGRPQSEAVCGRKVVMERSSGPIDHRLGLVRRWHRIISGFGRGPSEMKRALLGTGRTSSGIPAPPMGMPQHAPGLDSGDRRCRSGSGVHPDGELPHRGAPAGRPLSPEGLDRRFTRIIRRSVTGPNSSAGPR